MASSVSPYYKFAVIIFIEIMIIGAAAVFGYYAFFYAGIIIGSIVLGIFILLFFAILIKFATTGLSEYTFEEAVARNGVKFVRRVIIRDSATGVVYFNQKGYLTPSQKGDHFYYGFPNFFGHHLLVINKLTAEDMVGNPIEIESPMPPEIYPDMQMIRTKTAVTVKGMSDYQEIKQYDAALSIVRNIRQFSHEIMASSPAIKDKVGSGITIDDLTKPTY